MNRRQLSIFETKIIYDQMQVSGVETGWRVWNAAFVVLRYLESKYPLSWFRGKEILDLSCGSGVAAIALAALGAHVTATEIAGVQLTLIDNNVNLNKELIVAAGGSVSVEELWWGTPATLSRLQRDQSKFDMVIASDLLYIGIRDNIEKELMVTLQAAVPHKEHSVLLVTYQERREVEERAMMQTLHSVDGVSINEVEVSDIHYKDVRASDNHGADDFEEGEVSLVSLFGGTEDDALIHIYALGMLR